MFIQYSTLYTFRIALFLCRSVAVSLYSDVTFRSPLSQYSLFTVPNHHVLRSVVSQTVRARLACLPASKAKPATGVTHYSTRTVQYIVPVNVLYFPREFFCMAKSITRSYMAHCVESISCGARVVTLYRTDAETGSTALVHL